MRVWLAIVLSGIVLAASGARNGHVALRDPLG